MTTKLRRPRNPLVPAVIKRSGAGPHGKSTKAERHAARIKLQRKLREEADFGQPVPATA